MKTVEERAAEIMRMRNGGMPWAEVPALIARHMREALRDQRHLCAEAVDLADFKNCDANAAINRAHTAVMNAPEPGK